jgi:peroxiredoxin
MRHILPLILAFILVPGVAWAVGSVNKGDEIPHDLTLQNQAGQVQSLDTLRGTKGITLVFTRSLDWCPYCQAQTIELNDRAGEFEQAGYPVVTLSYDSPEKLDAFAKKQDIDITLLSDPASEVIKAFGLLNTEHPIGSFAYGIPYPAVYVIGQDKIVRDIFFEEDYKDRPDVDEMLSSIRKIGTF